jgi:O-antigen/teichoic acid export membrane protein
MLGKSLRNLGWLIASRGVNAAFSLIYLALTTRILGPVEFGRFALIVVMAQAVAGLASFSTWQPVVHWGTHQELRSTAIGFAVSLDLASIAGGSLLALVAAWSAPAWLPLPPELRWTALALCLVALCAVRSTPTGILRLHNRYDLATGAEAIQPCIRAAGAIVAAGAFPTISGFVCAWAVAELACAATYWRLALRLEPVRLADISLCRLPAEQPGAWRFVWGTSLSRSLAVSAKQIVLLMVGMLSGPLIAGGFRVASQLGQALVQLAEAISRALYPELVRAGDQALSLARRMALLALAAGALAVLATILGGKTIVTIVAGQQFTYIQGALTLFAIGGAIDLVAAIADALLVARGKAMSALALRAVPLAVALTMLPFALDYAGLSGAALCVAVSSAAAASALCCMAFGRRVSR